MQLAPRAPRFTVLGASSLARAKEFQARGIQHDIRRPFVRAGFHNDIHRSPPPRQCGVIRHLQIAPHQVHEGTHKAFRLAQRQSEDHPQSVSWKSPTLKTAAGHQEFAVWLRPIAPGRSHQSRNECRRAEPNHGHNPATFMTRYLALGIWWRRDAWNLKGMTNSQRRKRSQIY